MALCYGIKLTRRVKTLFKWSLIVSWAVPFLALEDTFLRASMASETFSMARQTRAERDEEGKKESHTFVTQSDKIR